MSKIKPLILTFALLALTSALGASYAGATGFNQFVAFGDSTLDTGYFLYHTTGSALYQPLLEAAIAQGATGGWAGGGVMNTTILAAKFGLSAATVAAGGSNYAVGGATTMPNNAPVLPGDVGETTIQQMENYLSSVNGVANPNALYIIKSGDNDATYYTNQGAAFRAANPTYLSDGAAALASEVALLQAAGARTIVVRNSYDSALFAGPGGDISSDNTDAYARTVALGTAEWSDWQRTACTSFPRITTACSDTWRTIPLFSASPPHPYWRLMLRPTAVAPSSFFSTLPNSRTICSSTECT